MQRQHHPPAPSAYSHEIHLQKQKKSIVGKVNTVEIDPAVYQDSLAAAAWAKQCRFLDQANAPAPFADQDGDLEVFQRERHRTPKKTDIVDKVNTGAADPSIYSANLEQVARGKAERFYAAATAAAPFAISNPSSEAPSDRYPSDYVLRRPRKGSEVVGKVGGQGHEAELYALCVDNLQSAASGKAERFYRAANAAAPFAVQEGVGGGQERQQTEHYLVKKGHKEVSGKPNVEEFDCYEVESQRMADQMAGANARVRNHGVPGLLRQDM